MTTTAKTVSAVLLAALLSLALSLSPIGLSQAQTDDTDDSEQSDDDGRPGPLTDEEREALQAEHEAARAAFLADVAGQLDVTPEELVEAFRTAAINQVNARVEAGELDEERAAEIIERIESSEGLVGLGHFGGGRGHHGPRGGGPGPEDTAGDASSGDAEI